MKENKRALRRWKSKCKFEKRIKIWVPAGKSQRFIIENRKIKEISSAELRDKIRKGEYWNFLKWTSTPCSCSMCSYPKYERTPKSKIDKKIWDDIQDDLAT
jgi:coenzyme F420-reducing hydrogenase alpha subunit